jgi:hypothetical protein
VTWALSFSDDDRLEEIVIHAAHVLRYTPFRISCPCGLDWRATPTSARAILGEPDRVSDDATGHLALTWLEPGVTVTLDFAPPEPPRPAPIPPDSSMLSMIVLRLPDADGRAAEGEH